MRINYVAQDKRDILFAAKEMEKLMCQFEHHGVGNGAEMWWGLVEQAKNVAEIHDATLSTS